MKQENLTEVKQLIKDIKSVKRSIVLLSEVINNAPDCLDACERSIHEVSLCVISRHQLIRVLDAMKERMKDLTKTTDLR